MKVLLGLIAGLIIGVLVAGAFISSQVLDYYTSNLGNNKINIF